MCWGKKKRHIMLTYIMQSPLSLSASHTHTCPHAHTLKYTSAAIQSLSNEEGTDAPSGWGEGGHTRCVCVQWDGLGTNTFRPSQARQCPIVRKRRNSASRLPAQRQMQKNDDLKFLWEQALRMSSKNKQVFFFFQHSCPQWIGVQWWKPFLQRSLLWLFFSGTM